MSKKPVKMSGQSESREGHGLEDLITWLAKLEIITGSSKSHYLSKPEDFLNELCYGMILPKLAVQTDDSITYTMVHAGTAPGARRTSTLDRKENIQLFLTALKRLKIKTSIQVENVDPKNEKGLNSVFSALYKLSKKIKRTEPLKRAPEYHPVANEFEDSSSSNELNFYTMSYHNAYEDNDELDEAYAKYLITDTKLSPDLNGAVSELVDVEENYMKRFLKTMEKLPQKFDKDSQIGKLVNNLRVDLLIPFHERFKKELEEKAKNTQDGSGPNVADVFVEFKNELLVYAPFIVRCKNLENTIDLIKVDPLVKSEIDAMEAKLIQERDSANDFFMPTSFNLLLNMPNKHIFHYKNMLTEIRKRAKKQREKEKDGATSNLAQLEDSSTQAIRVMHEILLYNDRFMHDADQRSMIRRLEARITHMQIREGQALDKSYGELHFETVANFKMETETKFERKFIIAFQSMIFIFEPLEKDAKDMISLFRPSLISSTHDSSFKLRFIKAIIVTQSMVVSETPCTSKPNCAIVCVRSMHDLDGAYLPSESFNIQTESEAEKKSYKSKFQTLVDRKARRPKGFHASHSFEMFIPAIDDSGCGNPLPPPTCDICKMFLFGQLFAGYVCNTCRKFFHENCFIEGVPDPNLLVGLEDDVVKSKNLWPLEWILGEPKDKSEKLSGREPGTFYIYPCDPFTDGGNKEEYRIAMVSMKTPTSILKLTVKTKVRNGKQLFYLASGNSSRCFPDLPSLVDAYKEKFHLNVPLFKDEENTDDVTNSASNSSDRLSSLDLSRDRIKSIDSRFSTFPTPPINEDEEDLPILEGPLNFVQMLDNSPEGTYVIQKMGESIETTPYAIYVRRFSANTGELKTKKILVIAVKFGSEMKYKINGNDQHFNSIGALIDHWRDQKFKYPFETNPLKNIKFYIGQKDHKEAERLVESGKYDFVLRENGKTKELRLTVKTREKKILHIKIEKKNNVYKMGRFENESIVDLINEYASSYVYNV